MNAARLQHIVSRFGSKRILVAGDLMLDEFIWGKVSRISPEAPVPVVEVTGESYYPGGAANVARNLREFAGHTGVLGLVGQDRHAGQLKQLLAEQSIDLRAVLQDAGFPTIVKTRIIARHQQVVRVDRETKVKPGPVQIERALAHLSESLPSLDAVILEDYGKGLLQQELVDEMTRLVLAAGKIVTVDPNPTNPLQWHGVTAIKPNRGEAFAAAGVVPTEPVDPPGRDKPLQEVGRVLLEKWGTPMLLITLGEQGMMLFQRDGPPYHTPTRAKEVFDVSGAGDTAIALFTLALTAGATPPEAAEISNHASGIVVGKLGTATVSRQELLASFRDGETDEG